MDPPFSKFFTMRKGFLAFLLISFFPNKQKLSISIIPSIALVCDFGCVMFRRGCLTPPDPLPRPPLSCPFWGFGKPCLGDRIGQGERTAFFLRKHAFFSLKTENGDELFTTVSLHRHILQISIIFNLIDEQSISNMKHYGSAQT